MSISPKLRFEILKRDGFRCVYCGASPPKAVLQVDHAIPQSKGGSDSKENLLTSCKDCNTGKGTRAGIIPIPTLREIQSQRMLRALEETKDYVFGKTKWPEYPCPRCGSELTGARDLDASGPLGLPVFQEFRCAECDFGWVMHWLDEFNSALDGTELPVRPITDDGQWAEQD